jgi:predicted transcriptional regulator
MKKKVYLTEKETIVMQQLWSRKDPMTSVDLMEQSIIHEWNEATLYRTLKTLLDKGFIQVCGMTLYSKQYARVFQATCTMEEYFVRYVQNQGCKKNVLSNFAMALAKNETKDKIGDLICELENVIEELKDEQEKG